MENDRLITLYKNIVSILDLQKGTLLSVKDVVKKDGTVIGVNISILISNSQIHNYLTKWKSWKNAYKYRKR